MCHRKLLLNGLELNKNHSVKAEMFMKIYKTRVLTFHTSELIQGSYLELGLDK